MILLLKISIIAALVGTVIYIIQEFKEAIDEHKEFDCKFCNREE